MLKKLTTYSLTALLLGIGQNALAHTGIKDSGVENKTLYTSFVITHGCGSTANPTMLPVIAQSVVFPNGVNAGEIEAFKIDPVTLAQTPIADLNTEIVAKSSTGVALSLFSPKGIQDKSLFKTTTLTRDALGNIRGIKFTNGNKINPTTFGMQPDLLGLSPFRVTSPKFQTTSCAKSLKVRIAIANWCTKGDASDDRRADIWIGNATSKFTADVVSTGFWPTMTVMRDLAVNPLPVACGAGYDVAIQPSSADIDANLPQPAGLGFWPMP
jgi:hypothetical protein